MPATRGRFAPSPTGLLHFGSLVAALASHLHAKARGGEWLVRMEDLDRAREQPGAAAMILRSLEAHGLEWDGEVAYQTRRGEHYEAALARLRAAGRVYACGCSRREIIAGAVRTGRPGPYPGLYPGTCRGGLAAGRAARAERVRVDAAAVCFDDAVQGRCCQDLAREVGDFVLRRADGFIAYQLAVVVDDAAQGVTEVVRGADLLDSTPRQIHLQNLLGLPTPTYAHVPVAVNARGEKLSKQTRATALDPARAVANLARALAFLGQPAPPAGATPAEVVASAVRHWDFAAVPRVRALPGPGDRRAAEDPAKP